MIIASLGAFVVAASLLTITPGLDTALVLRTAATGGARGAILASLGISVGCLSWAMLVALGLGALLAASALAYAILRWIGAAYLIWTGYRMLRHPRRALQADSRFDAADRHALRRGALTNLLNPKVGVFYVSFLPQFVPAGVPVAPFILLLGAIHALIGLIWFALVIHATRPISAALRRPATLMLCDRIAGTVFLGFGLRLAFESRLASNSPL